MIKNIYLLNLRLPNRIKCISRPLFANRTFCYRPRRSWGKVIFWQASVILLNRGGVSASVHAGIPPTPSRHPQDQPPRNQAPPGSRPPRADTPQDQAPPQQQTPPAQSMLGDTINSRAVRILLECNLVNNCGGSNISADFLKRMIFRKSFISS